MTRDDILEKLAASRPELDRFHVESLSVSVSYTHLTLPTIYSV